MQRQNEDLTSYKQKTINQMKEMSEREKMLLEIAKQAIEINQNIGAALSGSLMLALYNIDKPREAVDIDIICNALCENGIGFPRVPDGFKKVEIDGDKSEVDAICFKNEEGIRIDFMFSDENRILKDGFWCGDLRDLFGAKHYYSTHDKSDESRKKHESDINYIAENNEVIKLIMEQINDSTC